MQDDDTANPGMLWVLDGEAAWNRRDAHTSMRGVAARYPAFDAARGRPVDLEERIEIDRSEQQKAPPFPFESKELLAPTADVGSQSRGQEIAVADDDRMRPSSSPAARSSSGGKGSSTCPARNATTTIGARSLPARRCRRRIRPAIRSIASNGRRSARCNGVCATA
jgi:hypothetical protein